MDNDLAVPNAVPDISFADPGVAEVTDGGYILADSAGSTTMTVTWPDANRDTTLSVGVPITVAPRPTRSVTISGPDTVTAGKTIELSGMAMDSADVYLPHRIGSWSSSDTTIATVDGGVVSGVAAGNATITLTSEGVSATHAVTVSSAPVP